MHSSPPSSSLLNKKNVILVADIILFFVLLAFLPFPEQANKGLALLAFVAILWLTETLHVSITALLVPVISIFLGLVDTHEALVSFANPIIFLFFGGFALATALHKQKIDQIIANKIMALAKGKVFVAALYLFGITAFLSMWMSNTATAAMMLPLAMGILSQLDRRTHHNTYVFILLGIAYSASIGGMGSLVGSPPNAIVASQLNMNFIEWMKFGLPIMLLLLPLMVGTLYIIFKPKLDFHFNQDLEKIPLTKERLVALSIFILISVLWIFSKQLNPIISSLLGLSNNIVQFDSVIALLAVILICVTQTARWKDIQNSTDWGVLILFGGGITLSMVLKNSGASKILADGIVFMIKGGHFYLIGLLVATFIVFLTEFTSNTASAALLVPIFISIAQSLGLPDTGLALIIGIGASCAFMLPVATPPNAIVFGTGEIRQQDMLKAGFWLNIISIFLISTVAYFFWF